MPNGPALQSLHPESLRGDAVWRIEGSLVIATVADWHRRFQERLAASPSVTLDLAALVAIDVFGLQLLWSARSTAAARHTAFAIVGLSPVFAQACAANGFDFAPTAP